MATLTLELPAHETQTVFNLRRWAELLADPQLAKIEGRLETDRHGHIIIMPPPAPRHGIFQAKIARQLGNLMGKGEVLTECPISTADGVKAADVAWASPQQIKELGESVCFANAPEICVEVISPSNTKAEIDEKRALYFDAGAREVWICAEDGRMSFFVSGVLAESSTICATFPVQISFTA